MRIKKGFNIRQICGEYIVVAEGEANIDFSQVISINQTAACIWKAVADKDFTVDDMVKALIDDEYDVEEDVARKDCEQLLQTWKETGIVELIAHAFQNSRTYSRD